MNTPSTLALCRPISLAAAILVHSAGGIGATLPVHGIVEPTQWARDALEAMGGERALRGLQGVRLQGVDEQYGMGYSPDIDHPRMYFQRFDELRDVASFRLRRHDEGSAASNSNPFVFVRVVSDSVAARITAAGAISFGAPLDVGLATDRLMLGPERLLLTVLAAQDLRAEPDTLIQGIPHHVISIRGGSVRVYLNTVTRLPTLADRFGDHPDDSEWSVWGDVHERTWYSSWSLEPGGIRYPRTWTIERNGHLLEKVNIFRLDLRAVVEADSFAIPDSIRTKFNAGRTTVLGNGRAAPVDLADGVTYVPGRWGVMLVHQASGVVVVDAPLSSEYSGRVLDDVTRRFPGVPVTGLIVTDFMWAHFGGVREYVARKIPVFAHARNEAVLRAVTTAPHRLHPDSLATNRARLDFHPVSTTQQIGDGPNRIQLYAVDGPGDDYGRRIIVAYLPERHLMYVSDLYSPTGEVNFASQGAFELVRLVERNHLAVDTIVGSHLAPTPWSTVTGVVTQATAPVGR